MEINREESEYKWLEAAKSYEQELSSKPEITPSSAEYWYRIGYCYSLASRQAETAEEFKRLRLLAVEAYERAAELFKNENKGKSLESLALAEYTRSWIELRPLEKRKMLERCLKLAKRAQRTFKGAGDEPDFGKTCNLLALCVWDLHHIIPTSAGKRKIIREGFNYAMDAVSVFSKLTNKNDLILAYCMSSLLSECPR